MKLGELFWLGLKGISQRKLRTTLTILSIMIGIAAIVALISLVTGISSSITSSLSSIGPTSMYIIPHGGGFTIAQVASIESLPNVSSVIPMERFSANISSTLGQQTTATVIGVDVQNLESVLGSLNFNSGTTYNESEGNLPVAVLGYDIAYPSSTATAATLNEPVYLIEHSGSKTKTMTVIPVGILNPYGTSFFVTPDTTIFIPLQAAESFQGTQTYNMILVKATNTSSTAALVTLLTNIYGSSATIMSVQAISSTVSSITGSLSVLLGSIAGISLLVAGISILSIMLVSVAERVHEIGILKSLGFSKKNVLSLFLIEAVIIGFTGGVIGSAVGIAGAYALPALMSGSALSQGSAASHSAASSGIRPRGFSRGFGGSSGISASSPSSLSLEPIISPAIIGFAILLSVVVSVLSTLYPAWKASNVDPIVALRSE